MSNGIISAIGSVPSRRLTQAWSRYYYVDAISKFENADGLYYRGAHNAGLCVALYERARGALVADDDRLLSAPLFEGDILKAANDHGLTIFR